MPQYERDATLVEVQLQHDVTPKLKQDDAHLDMDVASLTCRCQMIIALEENNQFYKMPRIPQQNQALDRAHRKSLSEAKATNHPICVASTQSSPLAHRCWRWPPPVPSSPVRPHTTTRSFGKIIQILMCSVLAMCTTTLLRHSPSRLVHQCSSHTILSTGHPCPTAFQHSILATNTTSPALPTEHT
jgi:hypothetical protein